MAEMNNDAQFEVTVIDLDDDGFGEAVDGAVRLKIPGAAVGDKVRVTVQHKSPHNDAAWCRLDAVIQRGGRFRPPECPLAWPVNGRCGGCPLMHLTPEGAAAFKKAGVEKALKERDIDAAVYWHPSPKQKGYRIRGQFVVAAGEKGVVLGAYAPRSHDVTAMSGCRVLRPPLARVASDIGRAMTVARIPVFPMEDGVRYVTLRGAPNGAVLVDLVVTGTERLDLKRFSQQLLKIRNVIGVSYSINAEKGNAIRVAPSTLLAGRDHVVETVGDVALALQAASFSQLNMDVTAMMYKKAAEWVDVESTKVIWDLYSGVGGLGLTVAKSIPDVQLLGADSIDTAMVLARKNAAKASVNARYETTDLSGALPGDWPLPDVVLLNPPRRGLDTPVKNGLQEMRPPSLIYMSCNKKSFAADARGLIDGGYGMSSVFAYDMLPGTAHVELIAAFSQHPQV